MDGWLERDGIGSRWMPGEGAGDILGKAVQVQAMMNRASNATGSD